MKSLIESESQQRTGVTHFRVTGGGLFVTEAQGPLAPVWNCSRVLWDNEGTWAETTPRLHELRALPEGTRLDIRSPFDLLNPLGSQRAESPVSQAPRAHL